MQTTENTTTTYTETSRGSYGRATKGRSIYLRPNANQAVQVGTARLADRRDGKTRVRPEAIARLDQTSTLAQLVNAAITWADSIDITKPPGDINETFHLAEAMLTLHNELDPPQNTRIEIDRTNTCSHGVPFTAVCSECEL